MLTGLLARMHAVRVAATARAEWVKICQWQQRDLSAAPSSAAWYCPCRELGHGITLDVVYHHTVHFVVVVKHTWIIVLY